MTGIFWRILESRAKSSCLEIANAFAQIPSSNFQNPKSIVEDGGPPTSDLRARAGFRRTVIPTPPCDSVNFLTFIVSLYAWRQDICRPGKNPFMPPHGTLKHKQVFGNSVFSVFSVFTCGASPKGNSFLRHTLAGNGVTQGLDSGGWLNIRRAARRRRNDKCRRRVSSTNGSQAAWTSRCLIRKRQSRLERLYR